MGEMADFAVDHLMFPEDFYKELEDMEDSDCPPIRYPNHSFQEIRKMEREEAKRKALNRKRGIR